MENDISIKIQVDASRLDRVEREYAQILYQQRLLYNERWSKPANYLNSMSSLRGFMIILALFGALICVLYIFYPTSSPRWFDADLYLAFFIFSSVLFYFMPRLHVKYMTWIKNSGRNSCKRMARRYVTPARKIVPYDAEYIIKGDICTFNRGKEEKLKQLWSKQLKGYAVIGKQATVLFKKPTSILPDMLIIYEANDVITSVLTELGIESGVLRIKE